VNQMRDSILTMELMLTIPQGEVWAKGYKYERPIGALAMRT